jgi:hypothetical protein
MLPIAPACALVVARYLINLQERGVQFRSLGFRIPYLLITIIYTGSIAILLYTMKRLYPRDVAIYEYSIILAPLILIVPYVKKNNKGALSALPIAMGVLMLFLAGRAIPVLNDNTMRLFAEEIGRDLKEGDKVGVGSINISQQRLGIYLNREIDEVNIKWPSDSVHRDMIVKFLTSGDNIYLVISKEDYNRIIPDEFKSKLVLIDKRETWKTRIKRNFNKDVIGEILHGKVDILKDVLRHEVYLLTNKGAVK